MERDEFIDKKEFRGAVQDQVEEAYQFVLRHINMGAVIDGLYRHDVYELPTKSIREIIANACLHRSYMDSSSIYRRSDSEWVNGTTQSTTQNIQVLLFYYL
jgi:predicted HTH transcriptional regulator